MASTPVNTWIPWTEKSASVAFKSTEAGIGDGERKLGKEVDSTPYGQNHPYDMDINLNGVKIKADAKKLDNNTFNTGKEGRDLLRPTKANFQSFCENLPEIVKGLGDTLSEEERNDAEILTNVSPDEVCTKNIYRTERLCKALHAHRLQLLGQQKPVEIFHPFLSGKKLLIRPDTAAQIAEILGCTEDEVASFLGTSTQTTKLLTTILSHPFIVEPGRFRVELDNLVPAYFNDTTMVFVHETKGYYFCTNRAAITFERITRGHPRFRMNF